MKLINSVGPGELKLGLDVVKPTGISLYRPAQQDLTVSVAENLVSPEMPDKLTESLKTAMVKPMIRRFEFASLKGTCFLYCSRRALLICRPSPVRGSGDRVQGSIRQVCLPVRLLAMLTR